MGSEGFRRFESCHPDQQRHFENWERLDCSLALAAPKARLASRRGPVTESAHSDQ